MADPQRETKTDRAPEVEEGFGLAGEVVRAVREALDRGDIERVEELVLPLHYADTADLFERLSGSDRMLVLDIIRPHLEADMLAELDEAVRDEVLAALHAEEVAAAVTELETDDAVGLIEDLDEETQQEILDAIPAAERAVLEQGLSYPEDSAGRLMQRAFVAVPSFWNVGDIIDYLRGTDDLPDDFYDLFVIDPRHRPIGTVPLSRVLCTRRPISVGEIMGSEAELFTVPVTMDQEEVAFLFRQQDLVSAPVVDGDGRLLGVITVDDVVDVIEEELSEDLMHLGGVSEPDLYRAVIATTRSRFSWLAINLGTAILASTVIGFFAATIEQIIALAVLMPIVASMGGNAGTQTLTVAVRALAMKELTASNALRIMGKEVLVGGINGILFALLAALAAGFWFQSLPLALIMAAAMIVNLIVAGLAGAAIPLGLALRGIDPAVASAVFLTTITDVVGFFTFLGLAAWLLL
jgi:magnesium transporter